MLYEKAGFKDHFGVLLAIPSFPYALRSKARQRETKAKARPHQEKNAALSQSRHRRHKHKTLPANGMRASGRDTFHRDCRFRLELARRGLACVRFTKKSTQQRDKFHAALGATSAPLPVVKVVLFIFTVAAMPVVFYIFFLRHRCCLILIRHLQPGSETPPRALDAFKDPCMLLARGGDENVFTVFIMELFGTQ